MKLTEKTKQQRKAGYDAYMEEFETGKVITPPPATDSEWWFGYWKAHWEHPLTTHRYAINVKFQQATAARAEEMWNYLLRQIPTSRPSWNKLTEDQQRRFVEYLKEEAFFIAGSMNL